ncbi:hypothetical protein TVNIR_3144 [Thioalkalivibrio nitratireducens DSM 14787]|uniref:Uncharacterized protein n=1 Tax=Thioalkalivibrio nitratireducens (strain DSM 14787 / UNIQEM 213 / ALEN2) TaxID=1255043 RepID=L0E298_THIND|nr:hypothetical protein TVNIR_3144 [Thioalkalivibrio nitratireducens DSM 14787]
MRADILLRGAGDPNLPGKKIRRQAARPAWAIRERQHGRTRAGGKQARGILIIAEAPQIGTGRHRNHRHREERSLEPRAQRGGTWRSKRR